MRAIVSVFGTDQKGIIAKVSGKLYELGINVEDISQTIMQKYFSMIRLVDTTDCVKKFAEVADVLSDLGKEIGVEIRIQTEDIFRTMHRI